MLHFGKHDKWLNLRVTASERHYLRKLCARRPTDFVMWAVQTAPLAWRWAATNGPALLDRLRDLAARRPRHVIASHVLPSKRQ